MRKNPWAVNLLATLDVNNVLDAPVDRQHTFCCFVLCLICCWAPLVVLI